MPRPLSIILTAVVLLAFFATWAMAVDIVNRKSVKTPASGEITNITKTEITVTPKAGAPVKVPANDIVSITWTGDPAGLGIARSDETGGRLQKALDGYAKAVEAAKAASPGLKADLEYAIARTTAKMALADPSKLDDAIKKMEAFRSAHGDSHNFYDAMSHLGQLQTAKKDFVKAKIAFDQLGKAPWKDYQMASKIAGGRLAILENKGDEALAAFEAVIAMKADNALEETQRQEAMLGKAKILIGQMKHDEAIKLLDEVIAKSAPEDYRVQAEAYVRQGDCLQAQGKTKEAVLAYLHVDVLFPGEKALHAESLFHLARLWAKVGQPGRAAESKEKLETDYPNSEWTKQLKAAPVDAA